MEDSHDARERRAARNQALFRDVNERIEELRRDAGLIRFVCECSDESCATELRLTVDEYESVRDDPTHFVVVPEHVRPDVDLIVEQEGRFAVVAKRGEAAEIAAQRSTRDGAA